MGVLDRIKAVFSGRKEKKRIPPVRQVSDEEEEEIEELIALDII